MKDAKGKTIEVGQTLKRVVEGPGSVIGHKFDVILYDMARTGEKVLTADGGHVKYTLDEDRAKEFEVIIET